MTLMELMVVITIIGILMSLLIPAGRSARSSGRLATCQNNLKQMGLSLEMYLENNKSYPVDGENGYGMMAFLLPYVEEQPLYDRLQPKKRLRSTSMASEDLEGSSPSIFRCPEVGGKATTQTGFGRSTYLGTNILFPWQTAHVEIRDGVSNTIAIGETLAEHAWAFPGTADATPPNNDGLFASDHELGAHFAFCDGSVHFVDEAIDPEVFTALCTINGGEIVANWKSPKDSDASEDL